MKRIRALDFVHTPPFLSRSGGWAMGHSMAAILIISPDPEVRRTLQLAFELEGLPTFTAIDPAEAKTMAPTADGAILDMIDGSAGQWEGARATLKFRVAPTAILLPRGWDGKKLPKGVEAADLFVRKPYELLSVIRRVKELAKGKRLALKKVPPKKKKEARLKKPKAKR